MVHSISILGSTGSIGRQTVAVAEHLDIFYGKKEIVYSDLYV